MFAPGCTRSAPAEATLAELQEKRLWRGEVTRYAPAEYAEYKAGLRRAKDHLIATEGKLPPLRDWAPVAAEYRALMAKGEEIARAVSTRRDAAKSGFEQRVAEQRAKIDRLDTLSTLIGFGKSYREVQTRTYLTRAQILVAEADVLAGSGRYAEAEQRLAGAGKEFESSKVAIVDALKRFVNQDQITTWRTRVAETIRESRIRGTYAIVVSKVDRKLVLYMSGRPVKTYDVGLGACSIKDKNCAGDRATPEGKYRIVKKLPASRYHRALLINYPNEDDLRQFATLKRQGALSRRAGIGGLIEIHGGGKEGMTYGCVALDDRHMEEIFRIAEVGTPVTIVGATDYDNSVTQAMKGL